MIDYIARRVLMASYLYYRHDKSMMSDERFDEMCRTLAHRWLALDPLLQWQLGSAHDLGGGGAHCKITFACESGALSWAKEHLKVTLPLIPHDEFKFNAVFRVHWTYAS